MEDGGSGATAVGEAALSIVGAWGEAQAEGGRAGPESGNHYGAIAPFGAGAALNGDKRTALRR